MIKRYFLTTITVFFTFLNSFHSLHAQELPEVGVPHPWQLGLQEAVTPIAEQIASFHTLLLIIITGITLFVTGLLLYVIVKFRASVHPQPKKFSHNTPLEVLWTVIPVLILVVIAVPSFSLLYTQHRLEDSEITVQVKGYQWYWTYSYPDHNDITFNSFIIPETELQSGQRRLLDVDNPLVLPVDTKIRILVSSGDVLHAFAVPSFGLKIDAVPGRLNETWVQISKEGKYYGQCSELCGDRHGYMPVVVYAVSKEAFNTWVQEQSLSQ